MTYNEFNEIIEKVKKTKPILLELEADKIMSEKDISQFESDNNIVLPEEYKQFLIEYGVGYFGFANIYSLDKDSSFYLLANQYAVPEGYLAIADNECGDFYVLKIENGNALGKVFFMNTRNNK